MPYLKQRWPPEQFREGEWIPEMGRSDWVNRHTGLEGDNWVEAEGITSEDVAYFQSPSTPAEEKEKYLEVLGADIGSAQRDAYFYANFLEQLKQAAPVSDNDTAADEAADKVVERMKAMDFTSANFPEEQGGPPEPRSLRPWREVMNWLSGLLHKVGRFLTNAIRAFAVLARGLIPEAVNKMAVSFSAGIPPAVGFEIELSYFIDSKNWDVFKRFTDAIHTEMEKLIKQ